MSRIKDYKVRAAQIHWFSLILVVGGVASQLTASKDSPDLVSSGWSIWTAPSQLAEFILEL
jgi:hypothetical protein